MFTDDELDFIYSQNLSEDDFYDGRGESSVERHQKAKVEGKLYVLSSVPCKKAGHRLRTRSGHCIQCDPSKIKYIKRFYKPGIIYLAMCSDGFLKIGMVENNTGDVEFTLENREHSLNGEGGYGGYSDWIILDHWVTENAGRKEKEIHQELSDYLVTTTYHKSGCVQQTIELLDKSLDIDDVIGIVEQVLQQY